MQAIDTNPRIAYQMDSSADGKVGLHIACCFGSFEVCKAMIDRLNVAASNGRHINLKSEHERSALQYAVEYGHLEKVKLLVEYGADFRLQGFSTPLELAFLKQHLAVCKYLIPIYFEKFVSRYSVDTFVEDIMKKSFE